LSLAVVVPTAVVVGVFVIVAGRIALRVRTAPSTTTGRGLLVGGQAPVRMSGTHPQVFLQGAWWGVRSEHPSIVLAQGDTVEVVAVPRLAPSGVGPDQEGAR